MIYFKYKSNPIDINGTTLRLKVKWMVKFFAWILFKFFLISRSLLMILDLHDVLEAQQFKQIVQHGIT